MRVRVAKAILGAVLVCAPLALPVYAGVFDDDGARQAIIDLRAKVDANQKEIDQRLDKLEAAQGGQLDLANQIEALRQDMARLRGQIELLTNSVANQEKRERDFYADLDARLRKLEPQQVTIDGKTTFVDVAETRAFDSALALFKNSDFKGAISAFDSFVRQYPNSPYTPGAQYWLGTSYYATRDFKTAIATQQTLVKNWPDSPRAAEALLNIASSQADLGDKKAARKTLDQIIATYPDSEAAGVARERAGTLK